MGARGGAGEHEASRRLKSELLVQMDGVGRAPPRAAPVVLATTNRPWDLDDAVRRRLERRIYVPLPDEASRREMLGIHLEGVRLARDVGMEELARWTDGYSGADVQLVCRDASMMPMRRAVEGKSPEQIVQLQQTGMLEGEVTRDDFRLALRRTQPSTAESEHEAYARWNDEHGCKLTGSV
jgi:katanin p60 ATPase-containing subunit A1